MVAFLTLPAQNAGRGSPFRLPSISMRPVDQPANRAAAANLLGWRLGVRSDEFGPLSFSEAAGKADAAGFAFVEGVSTQRVSTEIPDPLDYRLPAAGVERVKARLDELRLLMPAYHAEVLPADSEGSRKLFELARALGVELIVCSPEPSQLPALDRLAAEFKIKVAIPASGQNAAEAIRSSSEWIGVSGPSQSRDRLLAVDLRGRKNLTSFLLDLSRLDPPSAPANYPPAPGHDGGGQRAVTKPLFFTIEPDGAARYDAGVLPAARYRVDALARLTPISTPEKVPAAQQQRIDAAIPRKSPAKPDKPRKLLVMDLVLNGSFYHGSIPLANLSLEKMAEYTGAFRLVFSNDLENLKYPKIRQYDGVFLNGIQGDVFAGRDTIDGLTRYVREGGGVAGLHAATWASTSVPEFGELMGATTGAHKYNGEAGALRVDDPGSPIVEHLGGKPFEFFDEFYHYVPAGPYSREKLHVLLSLDPSRKDLSGNQYTNRPDNDYGMVWIRSYGKGRVFNVGLGHRPEFYETPAMQRMILAGIQFVLGDLAADTTPSAKLRGK